ncbi:MAG: ABC transporter ATP-binding protein [Atribacterota bacterium]|nr:ABC transporter ATP-binding protein [Atribacterota bacterium]MDD4895734.1 ABC transporter ATP-binding protein [Atribacterota bacterium]MDD5636968.1 ABC transporter ATP-binding protein [Atribacterota bacterium]
MKGFGRGPGSHRGLTSPVEKPRDFRGTLRRLISYLKPHWSKIVLAFVASIASSMFVIISPKIMGRATTKLFEGYVLKIKQIPGATIDFDYILNVIVILIGLYILNALFTYLQHYIMVGVTQQIVYEMRKGISFKLSRLPLSYFDSRTHGEILSRVTNDIDTVSSTLQQSITQFITALVSLIGIVIMMLTISSFLSLVIFFTLPLSIVVTRIIAGQSQKYFKRQQNLLGQLNGHVEEMYTGHEIVKVFNYEKKSINQFNQLNEQLFDTGWKAQFISGIIMPLMIAISNLSYVFVVIMGGIAIARGTITIGNVQAFIQYSRQFTHPIVQTANIANIIQSTIAAAERVFEVLDEPEQIPDKDTVVLFSKPDGNIKFEQINFGYTPEKIIIKDVNVEVKKGQTVAIVGPTGAGKTTLVNLLMRFYEINSGKITLDGINIGNLKRTELRSLFGMVLQDTWLFKGTIKENIAYGKENATEEEIIRAAKMAYADHFISTLPAGYDTIIDEEAGNLSQGQKQLLTIARAILANPTILILDEATSSVDTRTEILIQKAMLSLMQGKTSFVIAHRLSTIREADMILVMNNGKIIENGTHEELLKQKGFYADLYNSQFVGLKLNQ